MRVSVPFFLLNMCGCQYRITFSSFSKEINTKGFRNEHFQLDIGCGRSLDLQVCAYLEFCSSNEYPDLHEQAALLSAFHIEKLAENNSTTHTDRLPFSEFVAY